MSYFVQDVYLCFVDYEKALDKICHKELLKLLLVTLTYYNNPELILGANHPHTDLLN